MYLIQYLLGTEVRVSPGRHRVDQLFNGPLSLLKIQLLQELPMYDLHHIAPDPICRLPQYTKFSSQVETIHAMGLLS
jgi:hypothetical protein